MIDLRAALTDGVTIRRLKHKDLSDVKAIERLSKDFLKTEDPTATDAGYVLKGKSCSVVVVDGSIVGFMTYVSTEKICYHVSGLYVDARYRGKGYAKELLNYLIKQAGEHEMKSIKIGIRAENNKAKSLYTSLGFKTIQSGKEFGTAYEILELKIK